MGYGIKKGDLYMHSRSSNIVEIISTYNKRDIDPDCPESVAIIGMVKFLFLTGEHQGIIQKFPRSRFIRYWKKTINKQGD